MENKISTSSEPQRNDNPTQDPTIATCDKPNEDPEDPKEKLPYPRSVFFIVSNEFCERFSFYGMRTILALYLKSQLGYPENEATVIYHVFIMICYFFPLLGAIVADSWLGKYKTILYLSIVYALGNIVVSTAAIPNTIPPEVFTMLGLVLIALGTGGIKPCVSAFGGDQFVLPQQEDQLQKFFSLFYFAINFGSFISTFLTPLLRESKCFDRDSCYSLAFGVPALLMILSIVIYVCGSRWYKIKEPEGNVVVKVVKCMWYAVSKKSQKTYDHWLDKAQDKYDKTFIDDIKAALRVLVLYIPLPIFWALFDQQGSRWTFQASRMNGKIGSFVIQPDQMQVVNPILILAFIPLFQTVVYPLFGKCNLLKKPLQRLTVGGILAAAAFGISALVELMLVPTYPTLPIAGEGQLRVHNGLPYDVKLDIPDLKVDNFQLKKLDMWEDLHIPVNEKKEISFNIQTNGELIKPILNVYEKNATSYLLSKNMKGKFEVVEIRDIDADKSDNGSPKVMVLYSTDDGEFSSKEIVISGDSESKTFTVNNTMPYAKFQKIKLSQKYKLTIDGKEVKNDIEMKQGGVYAAVILQTKSDMLIDISVITKPNTVHMLLLIPQYVVITAGEVMFSITGLEFSFTQAPATMKSLLQAVWLITVAIGNLVVVIVAQSKLFDDQTYEFILFAALMLLDMLIFALMAMRYKYVEDMVDENQTEMQSTDKSDDNKG